MKAYFYMRDRNAYRTSLEEIFPGDEVTRDLAQYLDEKGILDHTLISKDRDDRADWSMPLLEFCAESDIRLSVAVESFMRMFEVWLDEFKDYGDLDYDELEEEYIRPIEA